MMEEELMKQSAFSTPRLTLKDWRTSLLWRKRTQIDHTALPTPPSVKTAAPSEDGDHYKNASVRGLTDATLLSCNPRSPMLHKNKKKHSQLVLKATT